MATIRCLDCGNERHNTPRNTKFCKRCRLLRDVAYWVKRFKQCRGCGKAFAPLSRPDNLCSSCDPGIHGQEVDCKLCQTRGLRLIAGIPVCARCLRDPKCRQTLFDALLKGQRQDKERNNATT